MPRIPKIVRSTRIRSATAAVVVIALVALCIVRLADVQLVRAEALGQQADGRRSMSLPIHGTRGEIVDTDGTVLADTVQRWDLTISPRWVHDLTVERDGVAEDTPFGVVIERIAAITGDDADVLDTELRTVIAANPDSDYHVLATGLDAEQFQAIMDLKREFNIGFMTLQLNPQRLYPSGSVAGNLIGFMGTDGPLAGLEMADDACLAPTPGQLVFDRAADGTPIPGTMTTDDPAVDGGTLELTIDADVQFQAQQIVAQYAAQLQAQHGTIIVMRTDGSLVAVAETPTVDPNDPTAVDADYRGSWAFTHAFEPGSIFKTMAMSAMVDLDLVDPKDELTVPWRYDPAGPVRVQDAHSHPEMQWTATGAFVNSSNVGMVQMAEDLDRQDYFDYLQKFGFGEETIGFPGEQAAPLAADPSSLDPQTSLNVLFGQGIAVTPIQLVSAYQALANGGVHSPVRLVRSCTAPDGTVQQPERGADRSVVKPETAQTVLTMMERVTAEYSPLTFPIEGYRIAAKTGTAELVLPGTVGYDPTERITTTAGVFPVDDPQFIVLVQFDRPQTERTSAGAIPAFHDMVSLLIRQYDIPPSTTQASDLPLEWPEED